MATKMNKEQSSKDLQQNCKNLVQRIKDFFKKILPYLKQPDLLIDLLDSKWEKYGHYIDKAEEELKDILYVRKHRKTIIGRIRDKQEDIEYRAMKHNNGTQDLIERKAVLAEIAKWQRLPKSRKTISNLKSIIQLIGDDNNE